MPATHDARGRAAMEGWRALLSGGAEIADAEAELAAQFAAEGGVAPRHERLRERAYLRRAVAELAARARRVYLPAAGEHCMFRYFVMLGIQSMTVMARPDGVPSHVFALLFDRLDALAQRAHGARDDDHAAFTIADISTALLQARGDARALRADLAAVRADGAVAREELQLLRAQNAALVERLLGAGGARACPYI